MENEVELTDSTLQITRVFNAPRELVFEAFSDAERIAEWSGCAGATSFGATVDFRVGGGYRHTIQIPQAKLTMYGTYTEIIVPERIVYTLEWEPFGNMEPVPATTISLDFIALGEQTEIRLVHSGLVSQEMRENVPGGWQSSFDRLETTIAQKER